MENFQSDLYGRTGTVQVKSGMSIDSHLERCLLVQTAELYSPGKYVNCKFESSLVCPLIPILKWSKRQSCTVLGSS